MKGVVFNILEDMVVAKGGISLWQKLLSQSGVKGAYTAVETYEDAELFTLVHAVSETLNVPMPELVRSFGEFMFQQLAKRYPEFVETPPDLFSFLESIDSVIHLEVKKLYSEVNLPKIDCSQAPGSVMRMEYRSQRKLCILAEGLVQGAASHFNTPITISHDICMHRGSDHCELVIEAQA